MAASLPEPVVLAAAKDALYPEIENQPRRYAVVDTQFTVDSWGGWAVPASVRDRLMPFNAIRLSSGEPDLLGVGLAMQYEPTQLIVDVLEQTHTGSSQAVTLPELVTRACKLNKPLAIEVFITTGERENALTPDGDLDEMQLDNPAIYKSGAYFQFKAQLHHVGLLTSGGTDDGEQALSDEWQLEHAVSL